MAKPLNFEGSDRPLVKSTTQREDDIGHLIAAYMGLPFLTAEGGTQKRSATSVLTREHDDGFA